MSSFLEDAKRIKKPTNFSEPIKEQKEIQSNNDIIVPKIEHLGIYCKDKENITNPSYTKEIGVPSYIRKIKTSLRELTGFMVKIIKIDSPEITVDFMGKLYKINGKELTQEIIFKLKENNFLYLKGTFTEKEITSIQKETLQVVEVEPQINYNALDMPFNEVEIAYGRLYAAPIVVPIVSIPRNALYTDTDERIFKFDKLKQGQLFWGSKTLPACKTFIEQGVQIPYTYKVEVPQEKLKDSINKEIAKNIKTLETFKNGTKLENELKLKLKELEEQGLKDSPAYLKIVNQELPSSLKWKEKRTLEIKAELEKLEGLKKNPTSSMNGIATERAYEYYRLIVPILTSEVITDITDSGEEIKRITEALVLYITDINRPLVSYFKEKGILDSNLSLDQAYLEIIDLLMRPIDTKEAIGCPITIYKKDIAMGKINHSIIGFALTPHAVTQIPVYKPYFNATLKKVNQATGEQEEYSLTDEQIFTIALRECIKLFTPKEDTESPAGQISQILYKKYYELFAIDTRTMKSPFDKDSSKPISNEEEDLSSIFADDDEDESF